MNKFWREPWFQEIVTQVLIALLLATLSVLGYDMGVAQPREQALRAQVAGCAAEVVGAGG